MLTPTPVAHAGGVDEALVALLVLAALYGAWRLWDRRRGPAPDEPREDERD